MNAHINWQNLVRHKVEASLMEIPTCVIIQVNEAKPIREFVSEFMGSYTKGLVFYQLTKRELIQDTKVLALRERGTNRVFSGMNTREFLELPYLDVKVYPPMLGDYDVFVQSTSLTRKLVAGTDIIVLQ